MPRFCAIISRDNTADRLQDELAAMRARQVLIGAEIALGTIENQTGSAQTAFFADFTAVGEVTLDNRAEIRLLLDAEVSPDCSDLELLLRFYAENGTGAFEKLRGMFAVAIYDHESLLLVRDPIGARTCFYAKSKNAWAVSTSLKTLRRWRRLKVNLNLAAVRSFLTFAYLPGAETLLENVFELLPGHWLKLFPNGESQLVNYYEFVEDFNRETPIAESVYRLRQILEQATAERLPAPDESVGVFLSGGIDSSLVTALAVKQHRALVRTYSISFAADSPNEIAYSSLVAAHCRTRHRILTFSGKQIADSLPRAVQELDCPVGDPLTVPNLLLAEAAAGDGLRTVLNGEGGDPCFGGPKNLPLLIEQLHRRPDKSLAQIYLSSYRKCYDDLPFLLRPEIHEKLKNAVPLERAVEPFLESARFESTLNRLLYTNIRTKLAHHILPKVERLSRACNIVARAPLADKLVADFSFQIAPELKLRGTVEKWILKEAARDLLPATIIDRPKSGMRVPVQHWLGGALKNLGNELLLGAAARQRGLFDATVIKSWMQSENQVFARHGGKLWLLLTLELWLKEFVDRRD